MSSAGRKPEPLTVSVNGGPDALRTALERVSPNPSRAQAQIRFALARAGHVDLSVYDVLGREVRSLASGATFTAGPQRVVWDGRDTDGRESGAGVYFVHARDSAGGHAVERVVLIP